MIYHHCLNIECALKNADILKGALEDCGKILNTKRQIKCYLTRHRKLGRIYLPIVSCDNFDYKKGCLGHDD